MNEGQELVEAASTEIQPFNCFEAQIVAFEDTITDMTFDLTTEQGIVECEGVKKKLRKVEIEIEKVRKSKGKDLLKATKDLNESAKVWHKRVHDMYEWIDKPLQEIRQAELNAAIDAKEKEEAALKKIEDDRIADLERREAEMAAKEAEQKEKDDAAHAVQEAADREKEIEAAKLQAAEEAKLHAAQVAIDAAKKADQAVLDAVAETERKAKVESDRLAKEIADKYAAEQAEKEEAAEVERKRQENVEHRKTLNNQAVCGLDNITNNTEMSIEIVRAIVLGKIPNVTFNY
jgi:hypothetical protein